MTGLAQLAQLDDDELLNVVSRALDRANPSTLDGLHEPLTTFWLFQDLEAEVAIGGLLGYLTNSSGQHAPAAVHALKLIGMPRAATILERASRLAAPELSLVHRATKEHELLQPYASMPSAQAIVQLETALAQALYDDEDLATKLAGYLRGHLPDIAMFLSGTPEKL